MIEQEEDKNATREEVLALMDQRKEMEQELVNWLQVLETHGKVGMEQPLVDREGYPRNDIDIVQVRRARNRVIVIRNDLKDIMDKIERGVHSLHRQSREGLGLEQPMEGLKTEGSREEERRPTFAKIDIVSEKSPAESAGMKVGDEIVEFGSVNAENFASLQQVAEVVQHSRNQDLTVKVSRTETNGKKVLKTLILVPKTWGGRGLLGCNIVPNEQFVDR